MSDELKQFLDRVHHGITTFDFEGNETPCIELDEKKYDEMLSKVAGQSLSINTDLNILQDGLGNAFVEVTLTFSKGNITETFLSKCKNSSCFFSISCKNIHACPYFPKSNYGKDNVFMIQLPRPEKAQDALEIIENALIPKNK